MISFALVKTDGQARHATLQWDRMYVGPLRYQVRVHRLTMAGTAGRSGLLVKMVLLARRIDMSLLRGHMCPVRTPVSGAVTVYVMSHTFADKVVDSWRRLAVLISLLDDCFEGVERDVHGVPALALDGHLELVQDLARRRVTIGRVQERPTAEDEAAGIPDCT